MCLRPKNAGLITHYPACDQLTGFKNGDPLAINVVEAYETYLGYVSTMVSEMGQEVKS
jgi:hypothetical protein